MIRTVLAAIAVLFTMSAANADYLQLRGHAESNLYTLDVHKCKKYMDDQVSKLINKVGYQPAWDVKSVNNHNLWSFYHNGKKHFIVCIKGEPPKSTTNYKQHDLAEHFFPGMLWFIGIIGGGWWFIILLRGLQKSANEQEAKTRKKQEAELKSLWLQIDEAKELLQQTRQDQANEINKLEKIKLNAEVEKQRIIEEGNKVLATEREEMAKALEQAYNEKMAEEMTILNRMKFKAEQEVAEIKKAAELYAKTVRDSADNYMKDKI